MRQDPLHARPSGVSRWILAVTVVVFTAGCGPGQTSPDGGGSDAGGEGVTDAGDTNADGSSDATDPADATDASDTGGYHLPGVFSVQTNGFATSKDCASCHKNAEGSQAMRTESGDAVGMYDLWQASMMANAARDPFWRAMVSAEVAETPGAAEKIQDKCLRCHTPMAHRATRRQGNSRLSLDVLTARTDLGNLARDGVSCTACHQIEPDKLGRPESFTGRFVVSPKRVAYGPYDNVHAMPMKTRNGFTPRKGEHIRESGLCGSCHTLYTDPIDARGNSTASGHFPEQTPFLEWKNSQFYDSTNGPKRECQGCHEPTTDARGRRIETQIANNKFGSDYPKNKVPERSPYGRHLFIGGNTLVPAMIRDHADELSPIAPKEAFDRLIKRVRRQLEERTANVAIESTSLSGGELEARIGIEVLTGHKFPTGYPSRRAWLHVRVSGANGEVLFESGAVDEKGRIVGPEGKPQPFESVGGPVAEHHDVIDREETVQIYQSVMEDADGDANWRLMRSADYFKDNRLLPKGWSSNHPAMEDIEPVGVAGDSNFTGGGDEITYRVALPGDASTPLTVEVDLYYQVLAHRFANQLFEVDTAAVRRFRSYWRQADRGPETIDTASTQVQ